MATGTIKTWHADHGYGTLVPDDGGPELIVYYDSLEIPGVDRRLPDGQRVSYEATVQEDRQVAEKVRPLG
ncbi:cold-shock protein [Kitasatospora sp. CMC57]|uniref:Cold-shock protein n=1 Tax=Kitasatospora sp. CMC57 TaxID=3231513 RepID=A0AB33JU15_9ACTN